MGGSTTGALLGSGLPNQINGLDFAVSALFTVLAIDAVRANRDAATVALALGCALAARVVAPDQMLLVAFLAFTTAMLARYATRAGNPAMPDTAHLLAAIAVAATLTWTLRALPFAALAPLRSSPLVAYLATAVPVGVLTILACYTLRDLTVRAPCQAWPTVLALAITVALHLWRGNAVLSILGTTAHVLLVTIAA